MLAALAEDRLLCLVKRSALLALQLGDRVVRFPLPLVAQTLVKHQRQDVILVILPCGLAAKDVRRAPQVGFKLLECELHLKTCPSRMRGFSHQPGPYPFSTTLLAAFAALLRTIRSHATGEGRQPSAPASGTALRVDPPLYGTHE